MSSWRLATTISNSDGGVVEVDSQKWIIYNKDNEHIHHPQKQTQQQEVDSPPKLPNESKAQLSS